MLHFRPYIILRARKRARSHISTVPSALQTLHFQKSPKNARQKCVSCVSVLVCAAVVLFQRTNVFGDDVVENRIFVAEWSGWMAKVVDTNESAYNLYIFVCVCVVLLLNFAFGFAPLAIASHILLSDGLVAAETKGNGSMINDHIFVHCGLCF